MSDNYVVEYLDWLKNTRGRQPVTIYDYTSTLARFVEHIGQESILDVGVAQMEEWVKRPRGGRALGKPGAAASQAHDVAILRAFYQYLVNRGVLTASPAALLGAPRVRNANPRPIPDHDWRALWASRLTLWERVTFGLGYFVGLRRAEIVALEPAHVDIVGRRLIGFTRKGGGDDITPWGDCADVLKRLDIGADTFADVLRDGLRARPSERWLLPWGEESRCTDAVRSRHGLADGITDPNMLNRKMKAALLDAGLPAYTPHQLRHSFVTNLLRCGVPLHLVQRLANHSSPSVTSRYIKAGGQELREWMEGIPRI